MASSAHCDEPLCDLFPGHTAHLSKGICHDLKCRTDSDQTNANTYRVLRHHLHSDSNFGQCTAHSDKPLGDLIPVKVSEVAHRGSKDLHSSANPDHRDPGGHQTLCIAGQLGKDRDLCQKNTNGAKPLHKLSEIETTEILTGGCQDFDCRSKNDDARRCCQRLSTELCSVHKE